MEKEKEKEKEKETKESRRRRRRRRRPKQRVKSTRVCGLLSRQKQHNDDTNTRNEER